MSSSTGCTLQRGRTPKSAERISSAVTSCGLKWLQRGRTPKSAERYHDPPRGQSAAECFNGAALRRVRRAEPKGWTAVRLHASTGPHSEECGELTPSRRVTMMARASTGPHSEECGEEKRTARDQSSQSASTGPHSEECGEGSFRRRDFASIRGLQRGRTPESAESTETLVCQSCSTRLQRGRTPESAERRRLERMARAMDQLQRGRTPESAERPFGPHSHFQRRKASTGPHSGECGELRQPTNPEKKPKSFNGAALRRVRRGRRDRRKWNRPDCFNGAALRRVRRGGNVGVADLMRLASTGPHSGECGEFTLVSAEDDETQKAVCERMEV